MLKLRVFTIVSLLLVLLLIPPVIIDLHRGGTDAAGGHYDYDTGEYHYHHGYGEHSHYDMDGDGVLDCPYNFHDNTSENYNSGNSDENNKTYSRGEIYIPTVRPVPTPNKNNVVSVSSTKTEYIEVVPGWCVPVIVTLVVAIIVLVIVVVCYKSEVSNKNAFIKEKEKQHKQEIDALKNEVSKDFSQYEKAIIDCYGKDYLYAVSKAPSCDYIGADGLPHTRKEHSDNDKYTFYTTKIIYNVENMYEPVVYHIQSCRHVHKGFPINAYHIKKGNKLSACYFCKPKAPDVSWVAPYNSLKAILNKHIKKEHRNK